MSPEVLQQIKDPFFTTKRDTGGTGLGLAMSDRIVMDHGGRMVFESAVGQGTSVKVCFPVSSGLKEKSKVENEKHS
jgi:signal transduction histidine kinase